MKTLSCAGCTSVAPFLGEDATTPKPIGGILVSLLLVIAGVSTGYAIGFDRGQSRRSR